VVVTIHGREETLTAAEARDLMDQILQQTPGEYARLEAKAAIRSQYGRDAVDDDERDCHPATRQHNPADGFAIGKPNRRATAASLARSPDRDDDGRAFVAYAMSVPVVGLPNDRCGIEGGCQ
jgi:hypothetical protein